MSRQKYKHKARKKKETKRELNSRGTKNDIETLSEEFSFFFCCLGEGEKETSQNKNPADKKHSSKNKRTHTQQRKKKAEKNHEKGKCVYVYVWMRNQYRTRRYVLQ